MVWLYRSPILVGSRGVISSFKWFLPAFATRRGGGRGRHPVEVSNTSAALAHSQVVFSGLCAGVLWSEHAASAHHGIYHRTYDWPMRGPAPDHQESHCRVHPQAGLQVSIFDKILKLLFILQGLKGQCYTIGSTHFLAEDIHSDPWSRFFYLFLLIFFLFFIF